MAMMSKPSQEARAAVLYVTAGALLDVWSGVWYWYLHNYGANSALPYYFCSGLFLSGLVLLVIGLGLGHIARAARRAELPPPEASQVEARVDQTAAARAPVVAPANPAVVAGQPNAPAPANPPVAGPHVGVVVPPTATPVQRS
jgi:hypothetical protein